MASYSASKVANKTLSGTTVDTVSITGGWPAIEVVNRSVSSILWAVCGPPGTTPSDPTAAGDNIEPVQPGERILVHVGQVTPNVSKIVKVLGSGNDYSVVGTVFRG